MRNFTLLLILSFFFFHNCKNTPKITDSSMGINNASFYKHLVGTVGDKPTTLNLTCDIEINSLGKITNYTGYYYSTDEVEPHKVSGIGDSLGGIKLTVWDNDDVSAIAFDGKFTNAQTYAGNFIDTVLKTKLPFNLVENYSDALEFTHNSLSDSVKLFKNVAGSPIATFDINLLIPKTSRKDVADFLIPQILKIPESVSLTEDDGDKQVKKIPVFKDAAALMQANRDSFFSMYKDIFKDEKLSATNEYFAMNYANLTSTDVVYNEKNILSLAISNYDFEGGAHGNHGTTLVSYNLNEKKVIILNDVFGADYKPILNKALETSLRKKFKLASKDSLSNILFDNKIEATDNFCITNKGILFMYNPYEIASYAAGEIDLYVPFADIKQVLNPSLKL